MQGGRVGEWEREREGTWKGEEGVREANGVGEKREVGRENKII